MTREEAAEIIRYVMGSLAASGNLPKKRESALRLAIAALSQRLTVGEIKAEIEREKLHYDQHLTDDWCRGGSNACVNIGRWIEENQREA